MKHEIAMDKVSTTYSWHNISDQYIIEKVFLQLCKNGQSNLILCFFMWTTSNMKPSKNPF